MKLKSPLTSLALSLGIILSTHPTHAQMCLAKNLGNTGTAGVGGQCSTTSTKPNRIADLLTNHPTTTTPTASAFAPNTFVSNPINVLSGNKFEQADDLILDETDPYALNLTRYYNSQSTQRGMFGIGWRSGFEIQLQHTTHLNQTNQHTASAANPYAQNANRTNPNTQPIPQTDTIQILSTDGTLYHFYKTEVRDKDNPTLKHTHYTHPDPSLGYIKEVQNNRDGEHWHWHLPDGRRFGFVLHKQANQQAQRLNKAHHHTTKQSTAHTATHTYGQLSSVYQNPQKPHLGHYQLRYDTKGRLAKVTNHRGQSLTFTYQSTKHNLPYITVQSPIGTSHYFLDKHHNLSQVVHPNGTRVGYGYTDPNDKHNLTAKYHYANQASGTTPNQNQAILVQSWIYDAFDRAILSTQPDGQNKVSISYDDSLWHTYQTNQHSTSQTANQTYTNTLTNSLGQTTQYHYTYTPQTGFRLIKAVGAGCSTCDESTINHSFVYDDKGRVITRTALDSTNTAKSIHTTHISYDDTSNIKEVIDTPNNPPTDKPNNTPNPNPNPNTPNPVFYQRFEYQNPKHPTKPTKLIRPSVVKGKEAITEFGYDDDGDVVTMTQMGYVPITPKQGNQTTTPNTQNSQTDGLQTYLTKFTYAIQDNQKRLIGKTIKSSQDDLVHSEYYDYDQQGNLIAIHHGKDKQASEHFVYQNSPHGKQLTKHTSIQGIDTHYTYNQQGLITHIKRNSSNNTNNTNSEFVQIDYDNQNRPIAYRNHLNQSVKVSYDTISNTNNTNNIADNPQVSTTTHTITYTFDDGNSVIQSYDGEQNLLDEKTSTGISANQEKTNLNTNDDRTDGQKAGIANATSLVFAQQPSTHSQSKDQAGTNAKHNNTNPIILSLDVFGRLDTLTLPQGSSYTRQYDDFGRLTSHTDANTGTHSLSHNAHHLPTLIQDENTTTAITYNDLAMPTKRQTCQTQKTNTSKTEQSNQAQDCQTVSYHYDNKYRPTHINDQHQNTTYVYDDKGNVIKTEVSLTTTTHTTAYQYDSLGRITHTHLPEGITLIHHYDKHSQTTSIDYQLPNTSVWQTLARSLMGNKNQNPLLTNIKTSSTQGLVSFTYTNNTTQVNVYDQQDRLQTKHDHTTSTKLSYGINSNNPNNLSQIVSIDTNGNIINIDELTNAYTYDSNGNRTKHHHTHYTYEPNSDRLSRIENDNTIITYQYDKQGNPITITITSKQDNTVNTRHLDYTPDGQIKSIKDNDKLIATYQYNHLRQRIAKTTYYKDHQTNQTKEETTQYLWDKGLLSAEIKDDKVIRRYVYLDIMPVAVLDYGYDEKGKLNETKVYSIHTDHLGTPKAITNKNQETVWQIDLDTFGETKSIQSKDNFQFNLRFAGQYFDQETGYHYNYHRYYNPKVGRYLTSDPIGLAGGFNSYGYAYNRPYMASDVYGLYTIFIGGAMDHEPFQLVPGTPAIGSATWIIRRVRDGFRNNFLVGHFKSLGYSNYYALAKKNSRYYGFNEIDKALTDAKMYLSAQGNENAKINIVGHSLGGWQAAHLSAQISRFRCGSVDNLITLDPVGTDLGLRATQRKFIAASPKPKANFWINIRAEQLKTIVDPLNHYDNIIANAGGQWDPLMDDFLFPDRSYQLNVGHGNASKMMKTGILYKGQELTETPWSILKKSYINKGKAESFISVPDQPDNRGLETK